MTLSPNALLGRDRAAIIVRHAERPPILSMVDSLGIGLTEKGMDDAFNFGRALPQYPEARVWHSPSLRCHQTAEKIADGLKENGTNVLLFQEDWSLCGPYVLETECLIQAEKLGDRFMREWFEGKIDSRIIAPVSEAVPMVLNPILRKLEAAPGLDVHVSHDWDIMLLREALMGMKYEDEGWLTYLDGLTFYRTENGQVASFDDFRVLLPRDL